MRQRSEQSLKKVAGSAPVSFPIIEVGFADMSTWGECFDALVQCLGSALDHRDAFLTTVEEYGHVSPVVIGKNFHKNTRFFDVACGIPANEIVAQNLDSTVREVWERCVDEFSKNESGIGVNRLYEAYRAGLNRVYGPTTKFCFFNQTKYMRDDLISSSGSVIASRANQEDIETAMTNESQLRSASKYADDVRNGKTVTGDLLSYARFYWLTTREGLRGGVGYVGTDGRPVDLVGNPSKSETRKRPRDDRDAALVGGKQPVSEGSANAGADGEIRYFAKHPNETNSVLLPSARNAFAQYYMYGLSMERLAQTVLSNPSVPLKNVRLENAFSFRDPQWSAILPNFSPVRVADHAIDYRDPKTWEWKHTNAYMDRAISGTRYMVSYKRKSVETQDVRAYVVDPNKWSDGEYDYDAPLPAERLDLITEKLFGGWKFANQIQTPDSPGIIKKAFVLDVPYEIPEHPRMVEDWLEFAELDPVVPEPMSEVKGFRPLRLTLKAKSQGAVRTALAEKPNSLYVHERENAYAGAFNQLSRYDHFGLVHRPKLEVKEDGKCSYVFDEGYNIVLCGHLQRRLWNYALPEVFALNLQVAKADLVKLFYAGPILCRTNVNDGYGPLAVYLPTGFVFARKKRWFTLTSVPIQHGSSEAPGWALEKDGVAVFWKNKERNSQHDAWNPTKDTHRWILCDSEATLNKCDTEAVVRVPEPHQAKPNEIKTYKLSHEERAIGSDILSTLIGQSKYDSCDDGWDNHPYLKWLHILGHKHVCLDTTEDVRLIAVWYGRTSLDVEAYLKS